MFGREETVGPLLTPRMVREGVSSYLAALQSPLLPEPDNRQPLPSQASLPIVRPDHNHRDPLYPAFNDSDYLVAVAVNTLNGTKVADSIEIAQARRGKYRRIRPDMAFYQELLGASLNIFDIKVQDLKASNELLRASIPRILQGGKRLVALWVDQARWRKLLEPSESGDGIISQHLLIHGYEACQGGYNAEVWDGTARKNLKVPIDTLLRSRKPSPILATNIVTVFILTE